jgi:hypothetical protein
MVEMNIGGEFNSFHHEDFIGFQYLGPTKPPGARFFYEPVDYMY